MAPLVGHTCHQWLAEHRRAWRTGSAAPIPQPPDGEVLIQGLTKTVHSGNILFHSRLPSAIIDLSLYWRPPTYGSTIVVTDAVCFEGAAIRLVDEVSTGPNFTQYVLRALVFRIATISRWTAARRLAALLGPTPLLWGWPVPTRGRTSDEPVWVPAERLTPQQMRARTRGRATPTLRVVLGSRPQIVRSAMKGPQSPPGRLDRRFHPAAKRRGSQPLMGQRHQSVLPWRSLRRISGLAKRCAQGWYEMCTGAEDQKD
jgi:hypothetical protein